MSKVKLYRARVNGDALEVHFQLAEDTGDTYVFDSRYGAVSQGLVAVSKDVAAVLGISTDQRQSAEMLIDAVCSHAEIAYRSAIGMSKKANAIMLAALRGVPDAIDGSGIDAQTASQGGGDA